MNHILRRAAAALLCLALLCTALPVFAGQSDWDVTLQFLHGQAKVPSAANTYGDWEVFALARTGAFLPDSYYAAYLTLVERALEECKPTDRYQFLRMGYFAPDNKDCKDGRLVFNRAVALKDSFKK